MIYSPEFWIRGNFRSKVKSPLEMVASAVRAVGGDVDYANALVGLMNQLGEPLYRKIGADRLLQPRHGLDEFRMASGAHEFRARS